MQDFSWQKCAILWGAAKSVSQFRILIKFRQPSPHQASLIAWRAALQRLPDGTQMNFIFWPCHRFTHDLQRRQHLSASALSLPINAVFLWRTDGAPRAHGRWSWDESARVWPEITDTIVGPEWNAAILLLSWKVTDPFCSRATERPKLLAVPTTLPLSLGHGGPCVLWAVGLMVPWALCETRDPRELCTELSLCQKNVPQSLHEWCLLRYYYVFHHLRFTSHGLWNMFSGNRGLRVGWKVAKVTVAYLNVWALTEHCHLTTRNCRCRYFLDNSISSSLLTECDILNKLRFSCPAEVKYGCRAEQTFKTTYSCTGERERNILGGKRKDAYNKNLYKKMFHTSWCCSVHRQILHPGTVEHLTPRCRDFSNYGWQLPIRVGGGSPLEVPGRIRSAPQH